MKSSGTSDPDPYEGIPTGPELGLEHGERGTSSGDSAPADAPWTEEEPFPERHRARPGDDE